jgi:hypothetical protein
MDKELLKKMIADYEYYMATVGSWESKKTIEEKLAAWRVELELEKRAKSAADLLGIRLNLTEGL